LQVPAEAVLREIRNKMDGQLTRLHLVTKKDLHNIEQAFQLNKPERQHADDATSVDVFVRSFDEKDSPVIAYKRQGVSDFDILPPDVSTTLAKEDFVIVLMDSAQCEMLVKYGSGPMSVICCDSTHGTNGYDFSLTTVMVLDDNRQGFPVAFLYSTKITEETFMIMFEAMKSQCGVISCNTFMSDMAPQFYNAWKLVMGECAHRLYCAWHVDKSFRQNTRRLIHNPEMMSRTYKALRTLMDETDLETFTQALPQFVKQLNGNPDTSSFGKFFESLYSL